MGRLLTLFGDTRVRSALAKALPQPGLLGLYEMRQGASPQQVVDTSGNSRHGYLGSTPGPDANDPAYGTKGLTFDGVDDYAALPDNFPRNGVITIVTVATIPTLPAKGMLALVSGVGIGIGGTQADNNGSNFIGLYEGVRWIVGPAITSGDASLAIMANGGSPATLWRNGVQITSSSGSGPIGVPYNNRISGSNPRTWSGNISLVAVYNRPLSAAEMAQVQMAAKDALFSRGIVLPSVPPALNTAGMVLRYDATSLPPGAQQLTDTVGTAHATLGSTTGSDANDPAPAGTALEFDGVNDYAVAGSDVTGAVSALSRPVYEIVARIDKLDGLRVVFQLGPDVASAQSHGYMQVEAGLNRISLNAMRSSDGVSIQVNIAYSQLPPAGTWLYVLYHAGAIRATARWVGGQTTNGGFAGYTIDTSAQPLIFGSYNDTGGGRWFNGAIRHFAIYDGNNAALNSAAAFDAFADANFQAFASAGWLS